VAAADSFDLVVLGCGTRGREGRGAGCVFWGRRVAVVERAPEVGGSCINTGTVPSQNAARIGALFFRD